jgi:hypothetical protein
MPTLHNSKTPRTNFQKRYFKKFGTYPGTSRTVSRTVKKTVHRPVNNNNATMKKRRERKVYTKTRSSTRVRTAPQIYNASATVKQSRKRSKKQNPFTPYTMKWNRGLKKLVRAHPNNYSSSVLAKPTFTARSSHAAHSVPRWKVPAASAPVSSAASKQSFNMSNMKGLLNNM